MKSFYTPSFSFLPVLSLLNSPLPNYNFPQVIPFYQLIAINHDLYLRLTRTLSLHLNRSTPLRKTLIVNHYLRLDYFQHVGL